MNTVAANEVTCATEQPNDYPQVLHTRVVAACAIHKRMTRAEIEIETLERVSRRRPDHDVALLPRRIAIPCWPFVTLARACVRSSSTRKFATGLGVAPSVPSPAVVICNRSVNVGNRSNEPPRMASVLVQLDATTIGIEVGSCGNRLPTGTECRGIVRAMGSYAAGAPSACASAPVGSAHAAVASLLRMESFSRSALPAASRNSRRVGSPSTTRTQSRWRSSARMPSARSDTR